MGCQEDLRRLAQHAEILLRAPGIFGIGYYNQTSTSDNNSDLGFHGLAMCPGPREVAGSAGHLHDCHVQHPNILSPEPISHEPLHNQP